MDNWILKGAGMLVNEPGSVQITSPTQIKVKVSHLLLTDYDAMLFDGEVKANYPKVPGRAAVGIVTEVGSNLYGVKKGARVYFRPTRACGECLPCKSGKPKDCADVLMAGKDFDGFMRDFVVCEYDQIATLPPTVDDFHALCIEPVCIAENIYDKLNVAAGKCVAVVGADFLGNIIAQVLQYHKIIPIVIDNNPANLERVKKCGIYYAFADDDELAENIKNATAGTYCDAAVYSAGSGMPVALATRLIGSGKTVVLSSQSPVNASLDARDIIKKNITVLGVLNAFDYDKVGINMLVHNAVNIDCFDVQQLTEFNPVTLLTDITENGSSLKNGKMTILKMII